MATISFPTSPSLNQTYTFQGKTWKWNGIAWQLVTVNIDVAQQAWNQANSAYVEANTAVLNNAGTAVVAQAAFDNSNTKFSSSGGTIGGSVVITGNLNVGGTFTSVNTQSLQVSSNVFTLNATLPTNQAPTVNAAMIINRGSSANVYIKWNEGNDEWVISENGTTEGHIVSTEKVIQNWDSYFTGTFHDTHQYPLSAYLASITSNTANAGFDQANNAASFANGAFAWANAAYDFANTVASQGAAGAFLQANNAFNVANAAFGQANNSFNVTNVSFTVANSAASFANGAFVTGNSAFAQANNSFNVANAAFTQANNSFNVANAAFLQANNSFNVTNVAYSTANSAASFANGAFTAANSKFSSSGGTITGNTVITGNLITYGANVSLGDANTVHVYGGLPGQFLKTDSYGVLSWSDVPFPNTTTYTANSITLTGGTYVSGNLESIQIFGDYLSNPNGAYVLTDGTGSAPAWYVDIDYLNVVEFNKVVLNIAYTQNSSHTIYVELYNYNTSSWDSVGTYTGLGSYYSMAFQVISSSAYISAGRAQLRLYHSNSGNVSHQTSIDYAALEQSYQGSQGPRGPTGATGSTGAGVASGGTAGQVLIKNSSTNYDTVWADNSANAAYDKANSAASFANGAFDQANSTASFANGSFVTANSAASFANGAFVTANSAASFANGAFTSANNLAAVNTTQNTNISSAQSFANGAFSAANSAASFANGAFDRANSSYNQANTAASFANGAFSAANSAASFANGAFTLANNTTGVDNTQNTNISSAQSFANGAFSAANSAASFANGAFVTGNSSFAQANNSFNVANAAFLQANNAFNVTNVAYSTANSAASFANGAFTTANNALPKAGGTITGDLSVNGNLSVLGTTTTVNTQILLVRDNIITVDSTVPTNVPAPAIDSGIEVNRGLYQNTQLVWSEVSNAWRMSDGNTFASIASANLTQSAFGQANNAFNVANAAFGQANNAFNVTNVVFSTANSAASFANGAFTQANNAASFANSAFGRANGAVMSLTSNSQSQITTNTSTGNIVIGLASTTVSPGTYGGIGNTAVINIDQQGRATYAANVAITTAVADGAIYENSNTISHNYTISTGKNAMSAGPILIQDGATVTIPAGSRWIIL